LMNWYIKPRAYSGLEPDTKIVGPYIDTPVGDEIV
jgi:hypothetical protein